MTDATQVKEALAKRIEQTPVGPFAILLGLNDGTHFKEIVEARAIIAAALRARSPVAKPEPVAWQWRYIGQSEWNTRAGAQPLTKDQLKNEPPIEERPLYAVPASNPQEAVRDLHLELYFSLAKCIASAPEEYRADLCRYFRINPGLISDPSKLH